jgi:hypothetical protein
VDLSFEHNRRIVGDILVQVLMGGRAMQQKAFFLFLAVCDQHLQVTAAP